MAEPVKVRIGDCECPGAPHPDGDFAYFNPKLSLKGGTAGTIAIQNATDEAQLQAELADIFLRFELVRWDIQDDDGKPVPVSGALDGTVDWRRLFPLVDEAADMYTDSLLAPFRPARAPGSSPSGQTAGPTSPTQES